MASAPCRCCEWYVFMGSCACAVMVAYFMVVCSILQTPCLFLCISIFLLRPWQLNFMFLILLYLFALKPRGRVGKLQTQETINQIFMWHNGKRMPVCQYLWLSPPPSQTGHTAKLQKAIFNADLVYISTLCFVSSFVRKCTRMRNRKFYCYGPY